MNKFFSSCILFCLFLTMVNCQQENTVCEDRELNLKCGENGFIKIQSSFYGRASDNTCGNHGVPSGGCSAESALSVAIAACNGKQTCSIKASNSVFGDPCGGTNKYLTVKWKCVQPEEKTVCENQQLNLGCSENGVIQIQSSLYGRASHNTCGNHGVPSGGCSAESALSVAKAACNGKQTCSIKASNSVFGDPCGGTNKYLTVKWICVQPPSAQEKTVCENEQLKLECSENGVIDIQSSFYGRVKGELCGGYLYPVPSGGCSATSALSVAKTACNGKRTCIIKASTSVFGDPCPVTYKYLTVKWSCVTPNDRTSCEGSNLKISCTGNRAITVLSAFYGRGTKNVCGRWAVPQGGCSAATALVVAKQLCEEKTACTIPVNNQSFGDPCAGINKYMTVSWWCK